MTDCTHTNQLNIRNEAASETVAIWCRVCGSLKVLVDGDYTDWMPPEDQKKVHRKDLQEGSTT